MTKTRNKLKIMGLVLTMVLLIASLGVFSLTASAAEATIIAQGECGAEGSSVQWKYDDTGTLTISGTGAMESYLYQNQHPWRNYRDDITRLIIEEGVTEIGTGNLKLLKNVTTVTLPSTMKKIGTNAFAECEQLESVTLNEGLETIAYSAFYNCVSLKTIHLPASLTQLHCNAFAGCTLSFTVDDANTVYSTVDGVLFNKDKTAIVQYKLGNTEYSVPQGVTSIGEYAFNKCAALTTVEIPNSVTTIGNYSFSDCTGLEDIEIPNSVTTIGSYAFSGCTGLTSIEIPSSVTSMDFTFSGCTGLTSVKIPNSVTSIDGAFYDCTGLTSIEIPSSVTSMDFAFSGCTGLTSVKIPNSVTSIDGAFEVCTGLTSIEIPSSVTSMDSAFPGCTSLTSVKFSNGVTTIGISAFSDCTSLTSIEIPNSVTEIVDYAFSGCTGLTSIELPNVDVGINSNAFRDCTGLESIKIPYNVSRINSNAFSRCSKLTTVTTSCVPQFGWTAEDWETNVGHSVTLITEHTYENGVCTICDEPCPGHTGGNPTCTTPDVCTVCGTEYLNPDNHEYEKNNGICCETYQPAELNESGYYEISNAGQLFWFAQQVNVEGNREIKGVLTADIDLENRPWTPIGATGEDSNNFRGIFDGQNHTIKGLYVEGTKNGVGFFGEVRTGTVKNFTIYGEVVVNTEVDYVGGVIGSICGLNGENDLYRNGAEIQNITSYVNLTAKAHGVGMIGGFVGYANHQSLIENCSWYGTFDAGIYRVDSGAGGFIGKIQENTSEVTIRNCAAYGTIKTNYAGDYNNTATIYMGGFLSFSNTGAKTTLENCLFAGKFERGENLTDEAFLGAFGTLRSVNAIKNCYYLSDDGLEAVHSNSDLKPGSDNVEITSVTKAQLLSGEVAYKLGEHFGQILEGENRQSYPVLGGEAVPSSRFEIYGQQLNIGGDLSMKYYVMGYAPQFNSKGLYMEFSHNGVKTKVYADEPNADGFYVFVLEGINPQCMGDSIRAKLYYNETEVTSHGCEDGKEYSVEKNLLNLLEKYKDDAALVALINDTLAYGKAASEYKKHDTMTGDYTVSDSTIPDATVTPNGAFTGYTVVFGQVNFIKVSVELADGYTLYLDGTDITSRLVGGIFKTDGIAPTEFDKKFSFEIKNGDTVVQTFAVSVNDYIGAQKDSTAMGNLVKALYNYGVSAEIYNHVKTGGGDHYYVDNVCACGKLETIDATAMTADELKAAVADQLAAGETDITVTLKPDAPAEMITAIRHAICDTEGIADGSINLTLKGVTTIPGTTNWDGVAFGPGDIYDEAGELVDQELVTQLASINLPDVTEIGAQAFYFCENLVSVSAPKAQTIGAQALGYTALTSVEFPELTTIPTDMFSGTWTLSSAKFPKVTTIEQGGLLVGAKFTPENNPTPFPLELTAEGDITFNGSYHFNIAERNYTGKVDLVLNIDKKDQVTFHDDGTATWQIRDDLSYTFKSITFVGE